MNNFRAPFFNPFFLNVIFIIACLCIFYFRSFTVYRASDGAMREGKFYVAEGLILSYPYEKDSNQVIKLNDLYIKSQLYPQYRLGDYIKVYYTKDSKFVNYPKIEIHPDKSWPILHTISALRDFLIFRVRSNMPEPYAGLVLGMTIGYKEPFPENFNDMLISAGVIHVIVVSGYNVSLLQKIVSAVTARFGPLLYFLSGSSFLVVYLLIVGFEPPIVRAFIMGTMQMLGASAGLARESFYLLVLSGLFMLIYNPLYLTNLSFQFSFASTAFVILIGKMFPSIGGFKKEVLITICVSLAMYPLSTYYFGKLYPMGIIANVLISWIIPLITVVGLIYILIPLDFIKLFLISCISYFALVIKTVKNVGGDGLSLQLSIYHLLFAYFVIFILFRVLRGFVVRSVEEQ